MNVSDDTNDAIKLIKSEPADGKERILAAVGSSLDGTTDDSAAAPVDIDHLPIFQYKQEILNALRKNQVIVCVGETGSGKTTQVPQYLADTNVLGDGIVGITQPRRVATTSVARRVAEERDCPLGTEVGYVIRFDDCTNRDTQIKFLTDGCLVRECLIDPLLSRYKVIMLDEAHERSIDTDILFGLLKNILKKSHCPVVIVPGRSFHVDIYHSKQNMVINEKGPVSGYQKSGVDITLRIHYEEDEGHILFFLTGRDEIEEACSAIRARIQEERRESQFEALVLPLYGALQPEMQNLIFRPPGPNVRKIIVCTNIAETSLTVDGVRYVVDPGYVKQKVYNPERSMESLVVVPISQVAAQQRAGRAGRTAPGKCYRLYSRDSYQDLMWETIPEIKRSNLANVVLYLKVLGIDDVLAFDFLDPPHKESIIDALKQLFALGALDVDGNITDLGRQMSNFPLEPQLSRMILAGVDLKCSREALTISAMLSAGEFVIPPRRKRKRRREDNRRPSSREEEEGDDYDGVDQDEIELRRTHHHALGDHIFHLKVYEEWESRGYSESWCRRYFYQARTLRLARNIRQQLDQTMERQRMYVNSKPANFDKVREAVCAGFFLNSARKCVNNTVYRSLSEDYKLMLIHPTSVLNYQAPPQYVVYHELVWTARGFMRHVLSVEKDWIDTHAHRLKLMDIYKLTREEPPADDKSKQWKTLDKVEANATLKTEIDEASKKAAVEEARRRFLERKAARK